MDDPEDSLHRARQAYAARDWNGAARSFDAVTPDGLTADDFAAFADAVWWLGRVEDALRLNAAAFDALVPTPGRLTPRGSPSVSVSSTCREVTSRRGWVG